MRKIQKMSFKEIYKLIDQLDLFSRILIGQYEEILCYATGKFILFSNDKELNKDLLVLRDIFIPFLKDYGINASLGIWSENTPLIAKRAYDIQQCVRYQMAYHRNPKGDITVDFRTPYIHGEWNVSKEIIEEYHAILKNQRCGIYQPDYVIRNEWNCPVILNDFHEDTVNMITDDEEIDNIFTLAQRWYDYSIHNEWYDLFKEVAQITEIQVKDDELKEITKRIKEKAVSH